MNQVPEEASKNSQWFHESLKNVNPPEIITAAPEVSSVTLVVSSDDKKIEKTQKEEEEDESMLMGTTIFGRKTGLQDHTEKMNMTEMSTNITEIKQKNNSEVEGDQNGNSSLMDKVDNSTEQQSINFEKIVRTSDNSATGRKIARRRRVRVRVRPAVDDFVTAESQHFNSALNGLFRDQYKYNPIREPKPLAGASASPEKSILQDFLSDILKNDEPTKVTTTEVPETEWTMSPAMTTPMVIPEDVSGTTEIQFTTIPTTYKIEETTITESPYEDLFIKLIKKPHDNIKINEQEKKEKSEKKIVTGEKEEQTWETTKKWNRKNFQNTLGFVSIAGKYTTKGNDESKSNDELNDSESFRNIEEISFNQKESNRKNDVLEDRSEIDRDSTIEFEESNKESKDEDYNHPKNHRAKWSEVRYPSAFDHSKSSSWNYDSKTSGRSATTSIPGLVTKKEGDTSVKTLSDYVQAIFDTMKSAEEEITVTNTENPDETTTTELPVFNTEIPDHINESKQEILVDNEKIFKLKDDEVKMTTQASFEESQTIGDVDENGKESTGTESTTNIDLENATTLGRIDMIADTTTSSTSENYFASDPPLSTTLKPSSTTLLINSTESILGKVLRTSTTTKVSHMTEICYRGRCVMTRPSRDDQFR